MPRVKIDFVVSFSSEDPEHPANNLLEREVSKKRWLCGKGETSCSVVLQLGRTVQISAVHIGVHHSALVEVLVGRSETVNDPFQVLIPSCTFLNPMDSRKSEGLERVRSFTAEQMTADVRSKRWDRVRVVCSQPYNKHCQFGLSFIHLYEPESKEVTVEPQKPSAVPTRMLSLDMASSDEDDSFKPGELFAKHFKKEQHNGVETNANNKAGVSTDTQIRRASSQAIKNISHSATKLVKTPLTKDKTTKRLNNSLNTEISSDRQRTSLMYDDDDDGPHSKIDKIVQRHQEEKSKKDELSNSKTATNSKQDLDTRNSSHNKERQDDEKKNKDKSRQNDVSKDKFDKDKKNNNINDKERTPRAEKVEKGSESKKRKRSPSKEKERTNNTGTKRLRPGPITQTPDTLLSGVVFTISGYVNPRRANVRDKALAMGAKCERDWTPKCTHLICAFANTPKLKTVRSLPDGESYAIATAEWIEDCCRYCRLLPWQWYATEPKRKVERPDHDQLIVDDEEPESSERREAKTVKSDSDCDTEDEIDKVLQKQNNKKQTSKTPSKNESSPPCTNGLESQKTNGTDANTSEVEFVKDDRMQGEVVLSDSDTSTSTVEMYYPETKEVDCGTALANFFDGLTFVIDQSVEEAGFDMEMLRRHIYAYGGEIIKNSQIEEASEVSYVLSAVGGRSAARGEKIVRADWLWRCHEKGRLCSVHDYILK